MNSEVKSEVQKERDTGIQTGKIFIVPTTAGDLTSTKKSKLNKFSNHLQVDSNVFQEDNMGKLDTLPVNTERTNMIENVVTDHKKLETVKDSSPKKDEKIKDNQLVSNNGLFSDKALLKKIRKTEESCTLESPLRFWSIVLWICLCQFTVGYNQSFIGAFVVTLTNKKNFDWEKGSTEYTQNVSLLTSLYFLGCAFATCTQSLYLKMNQRKLLCLLQVLTILISALSCIQNQITLIIARVLGGYISGLLRPTNQTLLFQLTPPILRSKAVSTLSMFMTVGMISAIT